ncbi:MAG: glycosyltransferase family 2 protein [Bdellovibrionales bacterium]
MLQDATAPDYSIVIPMMNEAGNVLPLADAVADAMQGHDYELILVDDASRDTTVSEMQQAKAAHPRIRIIRHAENRGQSRGLLTGIQAARGAWIITLDGDMQNPPSEIPKLIAIAPHDMHGAVCGIRVKRQDTGARRWASRWANNIRRSILNDDCPDTGCSLKMFPRETFLRLPYFDHMHRYLPVLFKLYGLPLSYVNVAHQPRTVGVSKYSNWQRALVGITDLIGVRWLQRRTRIVKSWED